MTILMKKDRLFTSIAIIYFVIGLIFATLFALYYRWEILSFLSPGFYAVVLSWPYQAIGFLRDFLTYGLAGKPI